MPSNGLKRLFGAAVAAMALSGAPAFAQKEITVGFQSDRVGLTQTICAVICPAFHDYMALVNSKGGVEGYKIKVLEIDTEYKVPQGVEAYERMKKEGAVAVALYGTAIVAALTQRLNDDKIPGTAPGFGNAVAADGKRYPYLIPMAAGYWSQAAGGVQFAKQTLGGSLKGKKLGYLYIDNPAGREPLPILEALAKIEGFELKTFAVPAPGLELGAQVLDIAQRYRADFVMAHLFGRSPSVAIKEFKRVGYPLSKVLGFVWSAAEADVEAAGGFGVAEGYYTVQFAGVGQDYPVRAEIADMYKKQGKPVPRELASTVYYNRGIVWAAAHVEAIRNAVKAKAGGMPTSEDVKKGFETINANSLAAVGGISPPLEITAEDHEGGGWVQIFQVKGGKFVKASEWMQAYRDVVKKHLEADAKRN
ncbi:ABC transporter substrate-binding protein [Vineibacter terrae]|uniref:ABC transporter substrate-binding protein n=1 Tax=Vineibacter terrae TaxID=2586908 RepID=UPI002E30824F|nr:ABC transporter substrate-binding protein [Vineibacter terrae]HEX2886535.1 ABC transporter substrate-binding protein [Vineibacter terrae]